MFYLQALTYDIVWHKDYVAEDVCKIPAEIN